MLQTRVIIMMHMFYTSLPHYVLLCMQGSLSMLQLVTIPFGHAHGIQ